MREARIYHPNHGVYRCFSKVRPEATPLSNREQERLTSMLKIGAEIFQQKLLAYCVYEDCFDTVIRVPREPRQQERDWMIEKLLAFHRKKFRDRLADSSSGKIKDQAWENELKKWSMVAGNPSEYFKAVKQNFSLWRNACRKTKGSVWKGRFNMIPVEEDPDIILVLVSEVGASSLLSNSPLKSNHPFCSYAELTENSGQWRKRLLAETGLASWRQLAAQMERQSKSFRFSAFRRLPKQYGQMDLENIKKENRKQLTVLASNNYSHQQAQLAKRYGRLSRGHPGEKHDAILAEKDPELLQWVRRQRSRYRAGRMGKKLEGLLNTYRFQWKPTWTRTAQTKSGTRSDVWNQRFGELKEFQNKNSRSPKRSELAEHTLARWVTTQRYYRKKGLLAKERLAKLNEVGI